MMHFMLYVLTFIALEVTNGRYLLVEVTDDTVPSDITDGSKISTSFRATESCWNCVIGECRWNDKKKVRQFRSECTKYKSTKYENKYLVNCGLLNCARAKHEIDETCVNGGPAGPPEKGVCHS